MSKKTNPGNNGNRGNPGNPGNPDNPGNLHTVLGLMSGTSLDGLDMACCRFWKSGIRWKYEILKAETIPYPPEWKQRLTDLPEESAIAFAQTDADLGQFMGKYTREFLEKNHLIPDFISSHGHTVFHQPGKRLTVQIGKGSAIAAETGLPVVCDFRTVDVALGGQGAPLVPIGDRLLFPMYDYCLNLGGFANISFEKKGKRIAFDICPCNIVLNKLAERSGYCYDTEGTLAQRGHINHLLLDSLNNIPYYHEPPPKSLGKEWVGAFIDPILAQYVPGIGSPVPSSPSGSRKPEAGIPDLLHTFCEHIAIQIGKYTGTARTKGILITGGGALNHFLVERIRHHVSPQVILPGIQTIEYKEALIFAFLGLLRWLNEVNCLSSVTGASRDHTGGAVYR